jgi:hypothetical protein
MRKLSILGPKTLLASFLAALLVSYFVYLILPPSPRVVIPAKDRLGLSAFSQDCRFFACAAGESTDMRHWKGELQIWDTSERHVLFTRPYSLVFPPGSDGGYSLAFTPSADKLVLFSWGEAKHHALPSGEIWQPPVKHDFAPDGFTRVARLVTDGEQNLFVLVHDNQKATTSVHDLETGREISSWNRRPEMPENIPGGVLETSDKGCEFREIPSGKVRAHLGPRDSHSLLSRRPPVYHTATPDGRTLIAIDGKIRKLSGGEETQLELRANQFPAISPDGRYLAVLVNQAQSYGWFARMLAKIGIPHRESYFAIYDLNAATEVARIPGVSHAHFSLDGKTLALFTDDAVELYDMPLAAPWGRIVVAAIAGASGVFVVAQWLRWRRSRRTPVGKPV